MKQNFEMFLMEKHAEQYVGTDDCMADDFNTFLTDLSGDGYIEYGDMFAKEQSKELLRALERLVERIDFNGGIGEYKGGPVFVMKNAREAIAKAEGGNKYGRISISRSIHDHRRAGRFRGSKGF